MSELVDRLKNDHQILLGKLAAVKRLGIVSPAAKKELFECRDILREHLKREDELPYPKLWGAAQTDIMLKARLEIFAKDMTDISKTVMDFFNKYKKESSGEEFQKDIAVVLAVLGSRIRI